MPACDWGGCDEHAVRGYPEPFGLYAFCVDHLEDAMNEWTSVGADS